MVSRLLFNRILRTFSTASTKSGLKLADRIQVFSAHAPPGQRANPNIVYRPNHAPTLQAAMAMDPYLGIHMFSMSVPLYGPHAHAGHTAVTLLTEDSPGGVRNRDSHGSDSIIRPGGALFTIAGAGVLHEETPATSGTEARGFQLFINLPRAHKHMQAGVLPIQPEDVPRIEVVGGSHPVFERLFVCDEVCGVQMRISDIECHLPESAEEHLVLQSPPGWNAFALVYGGSAAVHMGGESARVQPVSLMTLSQASDAITVARALNNNTNNNSSNNNASPLRILFFSGKPLDEPVMGDRQFVGSSQQDLDLYRQRSESGSMGTLLPSFTVPERS